MASSRLTVAALAALVLITAAPASAAPTVSPVAREIALRVHPSVEPRCAAAGTPVLIDTARLNDTPDPRGFVAGLADLNGCWVLLDVDIAAASGWGACGTLVHEVGHLAGLEHAARGYMSAIDPPVHRACGPDPTATKWRRSELRLAVADARRRLRQMRRAHVARYRASTQERRVRRLALLLRTLPRPLFRD